MPFQLKKLSSQSLRSPLLLRLLCLLFVICPILAGCAGRDGRALAARMAESSPFDPLTLATSPFILKAWLKPGTGPTLHVYLEGDGYAWRTRHQPSSDPTPRAPKGFALALSYRSTSPVAYLARPCQYVEGEERRMCEEKYWTTHRFSESVVASMDEAIDQLKTLSGATEIALCGYSGGGAIAALLAERRSDVVSLSTVAGNLAVKQWTDHHKISPLSGSLDPMPAKASTSHIPQLHLVGSDDWIIPPFLARNWCDSLPNCNVLEVPNMNHGGPWETLWPNLWRQAGELGIRPKQVTQ